MRNVSNSFSCIFLRLQALSKYFICAVPSAIIKLPACLTLLTLETYNFCFIASRLLTVADYAGNWIPASPLVTKKYVLVICLFAGP